MARLIPPKLRLALLRLGASSLVCSALLPASAQRLLGDVQVHGFATQSVVYSDHNNYIGLDSSSGTANWTEAAINLNLPLNDRLRTGVQFHLTKLGAFGGYTPTVDWALADYSARSWIGVRAGKVKIRWGLYNDTQDSDPGYLWSLLPESIYGIDVRATNLSQYGAELYGRVNLGKPAGSLEYSAYYGYYFYATNDGYRASFEDQGIFFTHPGFGKTPGFDLRWNAPLKGLKLGGSLMMYDAKGDLTNGKYVQPLAFWPTYYATYSHHRLYTSAQYVRLVQYQTVTMPASDPVTSRVDTRSSFVMAAYRLTGKLQMGAYYNRYQVPGGDNANPANYSRDTALSARYDFKSHLYGKLEGHHIRGTALGLYNLNNSSAPLPKMNLLVAKVGVSF